ncbi:MAG TPA: zinc ribbon domain-containing protein [Bacteroidetes bacterium]|nr:zinc ribbon domain-containing protein [Bacteroidota bacterium]
MPIYEYRCPSCGHLFELLRSFADKDEVVCPQCGEPAQRLLSAGTGFIIKGGRSDIKAVSRRNSGECDRASPCCGAETRCDKPPCES